MKKILTLAILLGVTVFATAKVKIKFKTHHITHSVKKKVKKVIREYNEMYQCLNYVTVSDSAMPGLTDMNEVLFDAMGKHNTIVLNTLVLNDSVDLGKFASNITTELFETMVPAENNPITEPFKMGTNYTAREIRGLTIVLEKDDTYYDCSILEAAAADLLVTKYSGNLDIYPEYRRTAELLGKMVQKGWLTTDDLIRAQKTNGIKLIIGLILKKSEQSVTNNDILDVIRMFFAVYGGDEKEIKEKSEKVIRQRISNSP